MEEPQTLLTVMGLAIIAVTVGLLMWNKVSPIVAMVITPIVGALLAGFTVFEIGEFFEAGVNQVMQVVIMFIFAITFFGILSDAGIFDPIIRGLILLTRGNVILVTVMTGLLGSIANIDGSAATTFLLTVPALLGLYQALHMSRYLLLLMLALSIGIFNTLPWGGSLGRTASVTSIDLIELYLPLIPIQAIGVLLLVVVGVLLGIREKKRIGKLVAAGEVEAADNIDVRQIADEFTQQQREKRAEISNSLRSHPFFYWANVVLAIGVITAMLSGLATPAFAFLIGVAIALPLNFATPNLQMQRIRAHAPNALMMGAVILGAAVFLGVLDQSGMLESLSLSMIAVIPDSVGPYLHLVVGFFGVPLDLVTSTDAYYFSLVPIVDATASQFGVATMDTAHAMLIGNNIGTMVSPFAPALWLGLGLAGANLGDHLRYSFMIIWGFSIVMLLIAFALGVINV